MKKCMLILLVCLAVVAPLAAAGNEGDISVGVLLGQPLGLTGKYVINDDLSVAALVGVAGGALAIHADGHYGFDAFTIEDIDLYPYVGAGVQLGLATGNFSMGLNVPVGISYYIADPAIEVYLELVPGLNLVNPFFGFNFGGGIGARYHLDF
ncbi:MAG: hypothetical protein K9M84_09900 [Spirochaetia bacterium]|nr:hypothetical protein [Spirochaetia bacterium]MCF7941915.1 hypothetical protein [Spirochaetia bacterium]